MASGPGKNWMEHVRKAVLLLLGVALGVRIAWELLAPAVPMLVSLVVVLTVIWFALFGRHLHNNPEERKVLTVALMRQKTTVGGQCIGRLATLRAARLHPCKAKEGEGMPKKGVRVEITGKPRAKIDVDAMTQIVIALGRELEEREEDDRAPKQTTEKVACP